MMLDLGLHLGLGRKIIYYILHFNGLTAQKGKL